MHNPASIHHPSIQAGGDGGYPGGGIIGLDMGTTAQTIMFDKVSSSKEIYFF